MGLVDYAVFATYMLCVLLVGFYFYCKNKSTEDYYVGGRDVSPAHVGMSVVATDVGGGFSIGLGGLGFAMGLSGSWLLFTGLIGAWLSAALVIPKIKSLDEKLHFLTYPDFLRQRYGENVALVAALISGFGYLGFTGGQILAGAKLASRTLFTWDFLGFSSLEVSLLAIAVITLCYTVAGGLKAVIYTDSIQWAVLLVGLIFITIPAALYDLGGLEAMKSELPASFWSLSSVSTVQLLNWFVTIVPIWLIGMTLYQRIYACKDTRDAQRAWVIAGLLEYPVMAFAGVFLGMCARASMPEIADAEMGLPMLIKDVLPVGIKGVVIAAYFSAIMSTADSCLMASSGNFVNDLLQRYVFGDMSKKQHMRLSQGVTFIIGISALIMAAQYKTVLDAILHAYAFMVSGLFVPTLGALFWKDASSKGAMAGMLVGGISTLLWKTEMMELPKLIAETKVDPIVLGLTLSAIAFVLVSSHFPDEK